MTSLKEKHDAFIREIRSPLIEEQSFAQSRKSRKKCKRPNSDLSDIQDMIDIQRELDKKFDELFGSEDDE